MLIPVYINGANESHDIGRLMADGNNLPAADKLAIIRAFSILWQDSSYCPGGFADRLVEDQFDCCALIIHESTITPEQAADRTIRIQTESNSFSWLLKTVNISNELVCWEDDDRPVLVFAPADVLKQLRWLYRHILIFSTEPAEKPSLLEAVEKIFDYKTQKSAGEEYFSSRYNLLMYRQSSKTEDCAGSAKDHRPDLAEPTGQAKYGIYMLNRPSAADFISGRMRAGGADLHMHTTASDSSDSPETVCERVFAAGLKTFAVTDHDNTSAAPQISKYLQARAEDLNSPVYIPSVEISVQEERELHLLAYFPDGGQNRLQAFLKLQQNARERRNLDMIDTLRSLGYDITLEELNSSGDHSVGRMQMALLLKARGYVKSTAQAFGEILGFGKPGYIERPRPSLKESIWQIRLAGGVPVLAHPALYGWCRHHNDPQTARNLIKRFEKYKHWGLVGIECFHGESDRTSWELLSETAKKLAMLRTGGSDDHGSNKQNTRLFPGDIIFPD